MVDQLLVMLCQGPSFLGSFSQTWYDQGAACLEQGLKLKSRKAAVSAAFSVCFSTWMLNLSHWLAHTYFQSEA